MDECKQKQEPCPKGSTCVNTNGSFSCECPLGFDLEDGRTCSRGNTDVKKKDIRVCFFLHSKLFSQRPFMFFNSHFFSPLIVKTFLCTISANGSLHNSDIQRQIIKLVRGSSRHCIFCASLSLRALYLSSCFCLSCSSMFHSLTTQVTGAQQ